jgi:menaquinone-specific isochorismate synthase
VTDSATLTRAGTQIEPGTLVARSEPVDADLVAAYREVAYATGSVYERDGLGIFAIGEAARLVFPGGLQKQAPAEAAALLAGIAHDETGPSTGPIAGPLALGALGFAPDASAHLGIPSLAIVQTPSGAAAIRVGTPAELDVTRPSADDLRLEGPRPVSPDGFELISARPHTEFLELVELALAAIAAGEFRKVVVAREVTVIANRPLVQAELLERLRALYPSCATFAVEGFLGASPELLCRRHGSHIEAYPLAGTIARSGDPADDARHAEAFLASVKERAEHAVVVDTIAAALRRVAGSVTVAETPGLVELRNVTHLGTPITAELRPDATEGILDLIAELHPTPAVGGEPREAALAFLARHEGLNRDRYAGPVGYTDAHGNGEFYLGIRSAIVNGPVARLMAGVGIVAGSEPHAELAETQLKLQALLAAAVRP